MGFLLLVGRGWGLWSDDMVVIEFGWVKTTLGRWQEGQRRKTGRMWEGSWEEGGALGFV